MPLEFKNKAQLLTEAYDKLIQNTNITNLAPGGTARALLEIITDGQASQNVQLESNILQGFVSRATGQYLDLLGEMFGLSRDAATYAIDRSKTNFRFYIDPATGLNASTLRANAAAYLTANSITDANILANGFTIPQGITITSTGGASYKTLESVTMITTDTEAYLDIMSNDLGELGQVGANQLNVHNIVERSPGFVNIGRLILCTNTQPISNGAERENDQNFRFRISQASVGSANANETAIRLATLSVPGVRDVILKPYSFGIGTFSVFVLGDHPIISTGLLDAVRAAAETKAAAGIRVLVERPTIRGIELSIDIKFVLATGISEKQSITRAVRDSAINYINNISIGGDFIVNELIQQVMDVSENIKDIKLRNPSIGEFDVTSSKNRKVQPILLANQTAEWDEQFYTNNTLLRICEV